MKPSIGIVHLSDLQFGPNNLTVQMSNLAEQSLEHLLEETARDIRVICESHRTDISLILHTGDLAEQGMPQEFAVGFKFLGTLADKLGLSRQSVIIVPGNHDINWKLCSHSREQAQMEGIEFPAPYFAKFGYFKKPFDDFYGTRQFGGELFQLFKFPDLGLLVLGLNSCYRESESESDHYGDFGPSQVGNALQKAREVDPARELVWVAALHHSLETSGVSPRDMLTAPDLFIEACQVAGIRLVFHGHCHVAQAYVKGTPDRAAVCVLASGSAGLDSQHLPGVLNHYSVMVLRRSDLIRHHRQYSTRAVTSNAQRGTWTTDSSRFEEGCEVIPFDPPIDSYLARGGGSVQQRSLEQLRRRCELDTSEEIRRSAVKKYIPDLYVHRKAEELVDGHCEDDQTLANTLVRLREAIYKGVADTLRSPQEFEAGPSARKGSRSDKKAWLANLRRFKQKVTKLENVVARQFDQVLADGRPSDGANRKQFVEMAEAVDSLAKMLNPRHRTAAAETIDLALDLAKPAVVLIDRAGGGKTNLLCHIALRYATREPSLFISGRCGVKAKQDFMILLANKLGWDGTGTEEEFLRSIDQLLVRTGSHLNVFIDGINENRDIPALNDALDYGLPLLTTMRVRLVISCRDVYWAFFERRAWNEHVSRFSRGTLFEFSDQEQDVAIRKYLEHFKIDVELEEDAKERCRHPLVLRFLCEAYSSRSGEIVKLGRLEEIRLKPLFDDYWDMKTNQLKETFETMARITAEQCLFSLADYMVSSNTAVVTTADFSRITGVTDLSTTSSPYLRLLDEDIVIEELPTEKPDLRRVVFVYEEFMEYVAARVIFTREAALTSFDVSCLFSTLNAKAQEFVNVLGICEYICAFLLEDRRYNQAFDLLLTMANSGGVWDGVVSNVFTKYDSALEMALGIVSGDKTKKSLHQVDILLSSMGRVARPTMVDVCVEIGFRVAFPNVITLSDIRVGTLPAMELRSSRCLWDENGALGTKMVRLISRAILRFGVNPARKQLWGSWARTRKYIGPEDRRELLRALWNIIGGSTRRSLLLAYACNGLFDSDEGIRRVAALFSRESAKWIAGVIRGQMLQNELDPETRQLLS